VPRIAPHGYSRMFMTHPIPATALVGTGSIVIMLSKTLGFYAELERIEYVTSVAGTGSGASQTFYVRKGSATGTVCGTVTPTLATTTTIGMMVVGTITSAAGENKFTDTDTMTLERAASGTAFTAGAGTIYLTFRVKPQRLT